MKRFEEIVFFLPLQYQFDGLWIFKNSETESVNKFQSKRVPCHRGMTSVCKQISPANGFLSESDLDR